MGTHPIFESDLDCLTGWIYEVYLFDETSGWLYGIEKERVTSMVGLIEYCPKLIVFRARWWSHGSSARSCDGIGQSFSSLHMMNSMISSACGLVVDCISS